MRSILRKAAVLSASASLIFFWSCERHEVGELPDHQQHGKPGEAHHAKGTDNAHKGKHDDDGHGHAHDKPGHKAGNADDNANPADGGAAQEGTGTPPPGQGEHKHDTAHGASPPARRRNSSRHRPRSNG
jgi:hypothetical protein